MSVIEDHESYGDDLYYNPINYVPERGMNKDEFEEYLNRQESRVEDNREMTEEEHLYWEQKADNREREGVSKKDGI